MQKIKQLLAPPRFDDEEKTRSAAILNAILLAMAPISFLLSVSLVATRYSEPDGYSIGFFVTFVSLAGLIVIRRGYVKQMSLFLVGFLWLAISFLIFTNGSIRDAVAMVYVLPIILAALLLGIRPGFVVLAATILSSFVFFQAELAGWLHPYVQEPVLNAWFVFVAASIMIYVLVALSSWLFQNAVGQIQQTNQELAVLSQTLEIQAKAQAQDLALVVDMGGALARFHDLDTLLRETSEMIRARFDLYYVQVYLADIQSHTLTLRAGSGYMGEELVRRGHKLPLAPNSINGLAAVGKRPVIVADTSKDALFRANPLLPYTRSEMSIPLQISERLVGVVNLQGRDTHAFDEEKLPVFEALASQLAVAVENAELLTRSEATRVEMEMLNRRMIRAGWDNYMDGIERPSAINYIFNTETDSIDDGGAFENSLDSSLEIPITVVDEPVGSIQIEMDDDYHWTEGDLAFIQTVAKEVGQQIENLRLLDDATRYQLEAEKALRRLTHEVWQAAQGSKSLADGFVYNQKEILSLSAEEAEADPLITQSLLINDEVIGELSVASAADLDQDEVAEITAVVANQLSRHLENLRLTEATEQALSEAQRRSRELSVLNQVVTRISAVNGLRESMQIIVDEVAEAIRVEQVRIALLNEQNTGLVVIAEHYDASRTPSALGQIIPLAGNLLTEQVIETTQSQYISDARTSPLTEPIREMLEAQGIFGLALIPVIVSGAVVGTLGIDILDPSKVITVEQLQLAEAIVLQAATAVDKARLFEQTEAHAKELEVINQVAQVISTQIDQEGLLMTVFEQIRRIVPVEAYFVALHNQEMGLVEFPFVYDNGRRYQETPSPYRKNSNLGKVMESGEPLLINRTAEEIQDIILGQQASMIGDYQKPSASLLYVPLRIGQEILGVLSIHSYEINAYSQANTALLMGIANHVAVALDNARLLAESRKSAQRAQILREITGSISSTMDAESVLQTAAREIGRSLGLQTYVYLKPPDTNGHQPTSPAETPSAQQG